MTTDAANFTATDFSALAASRRSIRAYTDQQIPQDILDAILKDATTAPSWSNTRAFRVALATGERADRLRKEYVRRFDKTLDIQHRKPFALVKTALRRELPDGDFPVWKPYPRELRPAQVEIAKCVYGAYGIERSDHKGRDAANRRNVTAFDAPVMGFVFVHEDMLPWSAMDAGLMLQTLFLSAKSRGVDSCPIGFLSIWREPVEAEFEIPEGYQLITGFALGYADPEAPINAMQAPRPPIQLLEGK